MTTNLPAQTLPKPGTRLEMYVTHVEFEDKWCVFWAQIHAEEAAQVETLVETVVSSLESDQIVPPVDNLNPGDLCLAKFEEDQKWYRARVEAINPGENNVRVFFIDYGNVETIAQCNMHMDSSCFSLPPQAFHCVLANFGPLDGNRWSGQETGQVNERLAYSECAGLVLDTLNSAGGPNLLVEMYKDLQSKELLTAELIAQGCGMEVGTSNSATFNARENEKRIKVKMLELEPNVTVDVYVSHSDGPSRFWVHPVSEEEKLMNMMAELEGSDNFPSLKSAEFGTYCIAKYSEDGAFYRAKVTKLIAGNRCDVLFIDYGNSECVSLDSLKQIPENLCSLPSQAIICKVSHSSLDPARFLELVQDKLLHAKAITKSDNVYTVQLWDDDGSVERVLQDGSDQADSLNLHSSDPSLSRMPSSQIKELSLSKDPVPLTTIASTGASGVPAPDASQGSSETLYISAINSIHNFYGQLCKYPTDTLDDFMQQLNEHYVSNTVPDLFIGGHTPQPGDIGCAVFSGDGMWYRVRVIGARADGEVEIQFLDYGNKETKHMGDIKCLVPPYLKLPQQGINCCFSNLPAGVTVEGLEELLLEKTIHVCITEKMGDIHEVSLIEHPENAELLKVFPSQTSITQPPSSGAGTSNQANPPKKPDVRAASGSDLDLEYTKPKIEIGKGQRHQVRVVHIQDPEDFYCQLQHTQSQLDQLMENIDVYCNVLQPGEGKLKTCGIGIPCIAKYSVDNGWYRAVITGALRDNKVEVTFVDYGNNEMVSQEDLKTIPEQFLDLPIQGIHCSLSDVHCFEDNWPQQQIKAFEDATAEQVYTAIFDSYEKSEQLYVVELFDACGENFNEKFGSSCGKLNKRRTPVKLLPDGSNRQQSPFLSGSISPSIQHGGNAPSPGRPSSARSNTDGLSSGKPSPGRPQSNRSSPGRPSPGRSDTGGPSSGNYKRQSSASRIFASAFPAKPMRVGDYKDMRAVYTSNPSEFYCHLQDDEPLVDHVMNALQEKYKTLQHNELAIDKPQAGMSCVAWYPEDKHWYRAQLISVDDSITTVQYVDFGNCETISVNRIKQLLPQFSEVPAQAIKCSLHNVLPMGREWTKPATDKLEELLGEDTKVVSIVSTLPDGGYSVEVLDTSKPGDDLINNMLIEQRFAVSEQGSLPGMSPKGRSVDGENREEKRGEGYEVPPRMVGRQIKSPSRHSPVPREGLGPREERRPRGPHHTYGVPKAYMDLTFESGQKVDVLPSWVLSPHEFWVQLVESQNSLLELMEAIEQHYSKLQDADEVLLNVVQGVACIAQYAKDGGWYRGLVQGVKGNQVQVFFVDYGNSELIPRAKVKDADPQLLQLPAQCIKCKLKGVEPMGREWLVDAGVLLEDFMGESATCYIFAKTRDVHLVDIQSATGQSASDELINSSVARAQHKNESDASSHRSSGSGASSGFGRHQQERRDQRSSQSPRQSSHGSRSSSISDGNNHRAPPFDTSDGWKPTRSVQSQGDRREDNRGFGVGRDGGGRNFDRKGGRDFRGGGGSGDGGFGGKHGRDGGFQSRQDRDSGSQRGQDRSGGGFRSDRGGGEFGRERQQKREDPSFDSRGNRGDGFQKGGEGFESGRQPPQKHATGGGFSDGSGGDFTIKASEDEWGMEDSSASPTTDTTTQKTDLVYKEIEFSLGDAKDIVVSHIETPGCFYVQLASNVSELDKLMWDIEGHYSKIEEYKESLPNPATGNPCAAKFSEDGMWYRAIVQNIMSSSQVSVQFVDYGNSEVVQTASLKKIKSEYMTLGAQAVKCALPNFSPGAPAEATAAFSKLTVGKDINCKCLEKKGGVNQVEMLEKGSGANINEEMAKHIPSGTADIISVSATQGEVGFISHAASPSNFYVQLTKDESNLNTLVENLNAEYSAMAAEENLLSRVKVGQLCCAKFSEDESWYRAMVTDVTDDSQVVVKFIDFGNRDELTLMDIKEMKADYVGIPAMAIQCTLAKTNPVGDCGSWSPEACAKFQELTTDQEVRVIFNSDLEPYNVRLLREDCDIGKELVQLGYATEKPSSRRSSTHSVEIQDPATLSGRKIQPPVIPVNQTVKGYISHVETVSCFFVQTSGIEKTLDLLMNQLESEYSSLGPNDRTLPSPEPGVACCAQYSEDQAWYRAVITSIDKDTARICFVDYGNCESTKVSALKSLSAELAKKPVMAVRCTLVLTEESDIPEDATNLLIEKTQDRELSLTFLTRTEPCLVKLQDDEGKDLIVGLPVAVVTSGGQVAAPRVPAFPTYKMPSIVEEKKETVYVTHTNSPSQFWCQLARGEDQLAELMAQIAKHYDPLPYTDIPNKKVSMPCVAKYSEDGAWYRAKILRPGLKNCDVIFVDYGNVENVSMQDIRPMEKRFMELEVMAVECALQGVRSPQGPWSKETIAHFQEMVADISLTAEIVMLGTAGEDNTDLGCMINLLLDSGLSVAVKLIEKGLAEKTGSFAEGSPIRPKPTPEAVESLDDSVLEAASEGQNLETGTAAVDEFVAAGTKYEPVKLEDGEKREVYVSFVNTPSQFWIQLKDQQVKLDALMDRLAEEYSNATPALESPETSMACVVKFEEDQAWYRAVILEVKGQEAVVHYVDYGNQALIPLSDIKPLKSELCSLPIQAVECLLAGVRSEGGTWTTDVNDRFTELTTDKSLLCEVVSVGDDWTCMVKLLDMGMSIAQNLIDGQLAEDSNRPLNTGRKPVKYTPPSLEVGSRIQVYISASSSPADFYCQPASSSNELPILRDTIQDLYSQFTETRQHCLENPLPGKPCVALFSEDKAWYRGVISGVKEEGVDVTFVDYGNHECVELSKVKELQMEVSKLPIQAIKCRLSGILPTGENWDADALTRFEELTCDKDLEIFVVSIDGDSEGNIDCVLVDLFDADVSVAQALIDSGYAKQSELNKPDKFVLDELSHVPDSGEAGEKEATKGGLIPCHAVVDELIGAVSRSYPDPGSPSSSTTSDMIDTLVDNTLKDACAAIYAGKIIDTAVERVSINLQYTLPQFETNETVEVQCLGVESPHLFCVQLVSEDLVKLMSNVNKYCDAQAEPTVEGKIGQACLGMSARDGQWYRGVVVKQLGDTYEVKFVDYGSMETIPKNLVCNIPEEFRELPVQTVLCQLAGVSLPGGQWSTQAIAYFKGLCRGRTLIARMKESKDKDMYSVYLYDSKEDSVRSINEMLIIEGHAEMVSGSELELDIEAASLEESGAEVLEQSFCEVSLQRCSSLGGLPDDGTTEDIPTEGLDKLSVGDQLEGGCTSTPMKQNGQKAENLEDDFEVAISEVAETADH